MNLYIEENGYRIIVGAGNDPFLINNIASGILNCTIRMCNQHTYTNITTHKNFQDGDTGIMFSATGLETVTLAAFPEVQKLINLIKIRTPAFKKLLELYNMASLPNLYGFGPVDPIIIELALKDPAAISDYAELMNQDADFVKSELSMIVDCIKDDRFRIFTVSTLWKNKINQCQTETEINNLLEPMHKSFHMIGV